MVLAQWQGEIRGTTFGAGTDYQNDEPGWTGLGIPAPRTFDQPRGDLDGDVGGDDVLPRRVMNFPLEISADSSSAAMVLLQAFKAAWRPSPTDVALDLCVPGFAPSDETLRFYGRPRGLTDDLAMLKSGTIRLFAVFEALDPFGYGAEETVALPAGTPTAVTNDGDATSDRWTLELTRTGSASSIENDEDSEPGLSLVAGSSTLDLDGRARTILDAGNDAYGQLSPGSGWPILVAGTNTLTVTGASASLTFRPAYH